MTDAVMEGIRERVAAAIRVNQSIGIKVPINRHTDLLEAVFHSIRKNQQDVWTFVTVSKPFDYIVKTFKEITENDNVKFIDCISRHAGISESQNNCVYIESPVMLEKLLLEILHNFKGLKHETEKYIVIDSLSALMIYNNPAIIREFIELVMNRGRSENIHVISIIVEEEMDSNELIALNDKIIVLRDSFID